MEITREHLVRRRDQLLAQREAALASAEACLCAMQICEELIKILDHKESDSPNGEKSEAMNASR